MNYDDILVHIKEFGRYQKIQYVLVSIIALTSAFHSMNMVFVGPTPEHRCTPYQDPPEQWTNLTEEQMLALTYPRSKDDWSSCTIYNITEVDYSEGDFNTWINTSKTEMDCPAGWDYSTEYYETTIVSEVEL